MRFSESTQDDLVRPRRSSRAGGRYTFRAWISKRIDPTCNAARATPHVLVTWADLKRYKGVEFALRAIAEAPSVTRTTYTLDICGQGDDRPRLERSRESSAWGRRCASSDSCRKRKSAACCVVHGQSCFPSPKEGWGITNVEAAACGTPALASDSDGLRESVRDSVTGYLVPHGDSAALAKCMLALANDPGLVERLGRAAAQLAESLSWDAAARATLTHIEQPLRARKGEAESLRIAITATPYDIDDDLRAHTPESLVER